MPQFDTIPPSQDARAILVRADSMLGKSPVAALAILERAIEDETLSIEVRAEAFALIAQHLASGRSESAMFEARHYLARAEALGAQGSFARGRHALATGYLAFRESRDNEALTKLEEAIDLLRDLPRLQARAYDVLGMLLSRRGDLDAAHDALTKAVEIKRSVNNGSENHSLALTYGNLGRLELSRCRFRDAEEWLRHDLQIILTYDPRPATEAHVRNQLAQAIAGQGAERMADAQAEVERARRLAPKGSVTQLYVLKNVAMLHIEQKQRDGLHKVMNELRKLTHEHRFPEFDPWFALLQGREEYLGRTRTSLLHASTHLEVAYKTFLAREMPAEAAEAALDWAEVSVALGHSAQAKDALSGARAAMSSLPQAQRSALEPLDRRAKKIESETQEVSVVARMQRTASEQIERWFSRSSPTVHKAPSHQEATYCLVELRGLERIWGSSTSTEIAADTVAHALEALASAMTEHGAKLESSMGHRLVVKFSGQGAAAQAVLSLERAQNKLNELKADPKNQVPRLRLAAAIATSWSKAHPVGHGAKVVLGPALTEITLHIEHAGDGEIIFGAAVKAKLPVDLVKPAIAIHAEGEREERYRLLILA